MNPLSAPPTDNGAVYLATQFELARSHDFYTNASHWGDVRGALTAPLGAGARITEFSLDPFDPLHRAWVSLGNPFSKSRGGLWRTDNLDDPAPLWTEVLSEGQIAAALGGANAWVARLQASTLQPGLIFIVVSRNDTLYVGRSPDYGATWAWSANLGEMVDRAVGFELSDHDVNRLWVGRLGGQILVSDDRGATFTPLAAFGTFWNPYDIYVPEVGNPDDQTMFTVVDRDSFVAELWRSLDGGQTWARVTALGATPGRLNRMVGSDASIGQRVYYTQAECGGLWSFLYSGDGGTTWEKRFETPAFFGPVWGWPGEGHRLLAARQAITGDGPAVALYSSDGGFTWEDKTGDWYTVMGGYSGGPGSCAGAAAVTIVDAAALSVPTPAPTPTPTPTSVAAVTIEVVDAQGRPVSVLALNGDGWPTPNPLAASVTMTCPAEGPDCASPFTLNLNFSSGAGRFYLYDTTLPSDGINCVGDHAATQATYSTFTLSCTSISLFAGDAISHAWNLWVQPSDTAALSVEATYGTQYRKTHFSARSGCHKIALKPGSDRVTFAVLRIHRSTGRDCRRRVHSGAGCSRGRGLSQRCHFFRYNRTRPAP